MAHALASKTKTSLNVFDLEIGVLFKNLFWSHSIREQLQNITHSNPHTPDAGTTTTLLRVHSDSFKNLHHKVTSTPWNVSQLKPLA